MSSAGSVTQLLEGLKAGDSAAIARLLDRYRERVTGLARKKLRSAPRAVEDEEDVANKALWSLYEGARAGKFPRLKNRDDLWGLLVVITMRKAADQIAYWNAVKRGGGRVAGGSAMHGKGHNDDSDSPQELACSDPGPATFNILREEYSRLLEQLGDDRLRQVAELSVAGFEINEIAKKLDCARTTVFRRLRLIKKILLAKRSP